MERQHISYVYVLIVYHVLDSCEVIDLKPEAERDANQENFYVHYLECTF